MTGYALPDGYFYVDVASAQQFEANTGVEVVARVTAAVSRSAALDAWIQSIWLTGAETLVQGKGRALVGHERRMTALGIKEKLLSAGLLHDNEENADGAVTSVLYVVTDPGNLPIANKMALVRFLRVDDATTEIVWSIKVTATAQSDDRTLAGLVEKMLTRGVTALAAGVETAKL